MKILIVILLALAGSLAIGYVAVDDPGYVLITVKPWSVELSFSLFLVLLVALFIVVYLAVRFLVRLWRTPRDIGEWHGRRLNTKANRSQTQGMMSLIEGDWSKAEKKLLSYTGHTDTPVMNYVGAAHAAQAQGDLNRRDKYLAQAQKSDPRRTIAIGLTQAKLQYQTGQLEQALNTLYRLRSNAPKNKKVLSLILQVHQHLHDWPAVAELVPAARKLAVMDDEKLDQLEQRIAHQLLTHSDSENGQLQSVWENLRRDLRQNHELVATYAKQLIGQGKSEAAEVLLRKEIRRSWDPELVGLYGQTRSNNVAKQLQVAEKWAVEHKDDPQLLLTLARLSMANELWGKARSYLEECIAKGGSTEAYRELGKLLEQLEEPENALTYYRQGLEQASPSTSRAVALPVGEDTSVTAPSLEDTPLESDR